MAWQVHFLVVLLSLAYFTKFASAGGEAYKFFLDLKDLLDPGWVLEQHDVVGTRIQCASLCYQNKGACAYFGFLDHTCYLLNGNVDRDKCSQDDCGVSGMKVYKWKEELSTTVPPETSTTPVPTTTTTTKPTTTTEATVTTTETTTTTEEPTTTVATTTTTEPTTSTTESTTTTTEGTTTTKDATTTTTDATTTTTDATTTTTDITTTTTDGTTTTTEGFTCEAPDGQEVELTCPRAEFLVNGIGSRSPFFNDAVTSAKCEEGLKTVVYEEEEEIRSFFSVGDGMTVTAWCPDEKQIIFKLKLCFKDLKIPRITLHCRYIKDPDTIEDRYNVSSKDTHQNVQCGKLTGAQRLYFEESDTQGVTKVTITCVQIYQEDQGPPAVPPAPAGGP